MKQPNVLLIILDSVRARNVSLYDYHRNTTPFLEEYSAQSTVYHQARAPGIHSIASHASIWTGAQVEEHRAIRHEDELLPDITIWKTLEDTGYTTGLFTTNPVVVHSSNLSEPFNNIVTENFVNKQIKLFSDAFDPTDVVKHEGITGNLKRCLGQEKSVKSFLNCAYHFTQKQRAELREPVTSTNLIEEFDRWQRNAKTPWAACINLMDAHFPYEPADSYDQWGKKKLREIHAQLDKPPANEFIQGRPWWQLEAFEHLYDGAIRELDSHVENIINLLVQQEVHDDTFVVITSDHGEGFGELSRVTGCTRMVDHSWGVHEVVTHVPLVVKYPGQTERTAIEDLASLTEFPDTVKAVLDRDWSHDSFVPDGPVVTSTCRLREEDDAIFERSAERAADYHGPWLALYEQSDSTIIKNVVRGDDSAEIEIPNSQVSWKVGSGNPERVRAVFESFDRRELKKDGGKGVTEEVERRLSELGYLR